MDCYSIQNPVHGQTCVDDTYGEMVFNGGDGTWELAQSNSANIFDQTGNWIGTNLNFRGNSGVTAAKSFVQKNWIGLMIGGCALLILWLFLRKK